MSLMNCLYFSFSSPNLARRMMSSPISWPQDVTFLAILCIDGAKSLSTSSASVVEEHRREKVSATAFFAPGMYLMFML